METLTITLMESNELESLVGKYYRRGFAFCTDQGLSSRDTCNPGWVLFRNIEAKLSDYDLKRLKEFNEVGAEYGMTPVFLQDLCNKGELKPGNYFIHWNGPDTSFLYMMANYP